MSATKTCLRCGSSSLEPGRVQSTGRLYFRPANSRFMTIHTADIPVLSSICLGCGLIEFGGEMSKLANLQNKGNKPENLQAY